MRTRCGTILAAVAVATCAVGAEHCRPTGELQEKAQAADIAVDGCADVCVSQDVVTVTSTGAVSFVRLKMKESLAPEAKVLNDAWERSYGDLKWQTFGEKTVYSPWYFLAEKDGKVQGFGVETGPGAMCCWEVSAKGVTLVLDVRAGGGPVRLNGRKLKA